ncbi:MAG: hypothetical protein QM710_13550 [Flavobacterium sp.]
MNAKNFIVGGIVGGIVDYLLGWLFYGILFMDALGGKEPVNMLFIFLGCLSFGFLVSYIFTRWAHITTATTGLKAGAVLGLFSGLQSNFFGNSMEAVPNYQHIALDMAIMIVMGALVGVAVGLVNGKMK